MFNLWAINYVLTYLLTYVQLCKASVIPGRRMSATELFRSTLPPTPVSGSWNELPLRVMSTTSPLRVFCGLLETQVFSHFIPDCPQCRWKWIVVTNGHFNRFCYSLTYTGVGWGWIMWTHRSVVCRIFVRLSFVRAVRNITVEAAVSDGREECGITAEGRHARQNVNRAFSVFFSLLQSSANCMPRSRHFCRLPSHVRIISDCYDNFSSSGTKPLKSRRHGMPPATASGCASMGGSGNFSEGTKWGILGMKVSQWGRRKSPCRGSIGGRNLPEAEAKC